MKRIIGNWKMHKTLGETRHFFEELLPILPSEQVYIAVPFTAIATAAQFGVHVGSQNISHESEGAFTGEISARMVKEAGAEFALIGHSERRHLAGETDEVIHRKLLRAVAAQVKPVLCIGERLEEISQREEILRRQLEKALKNFPIDSLLELSIAYEPVWAIGTGKSASPEEAEAAHVFCREVLSSLFGDVVASRIPLLYGGSVKESNVASFLEKPEIQGVLVGGASLVPASFARLVELSKGC